MYAIFQIGSKQYRVIEGQIVRVEKLDTKIGNTIEFATILVVLHNKDIMIGTPFVEGSTIKGEIIAHGREKKVTIIKFRRRKHYRKKQGHRQYFTDVKITKISI